MSENNASEVKTHYRNCNICEAMCGIAIEYQEDQVISIKPDYDDPLSRGHICPKAVALQDYYYDQDRITEPLKRTEKGWEAITWEQAMEEISDKMRGIQDAYGRDAIATYAGNPTAHNAGAMIFLARLRNSLGSYNRFSSASADQLPHHVAYKYMFGHGSLIAVPDIDRTQYMLIIGGNPIVSNGSMMTAPGIPKRLKAIQKRGGKVVVIDPRYTETAEKADQHFFIKPNTDALLLLALNQVLFAEDLVKLGHLEEVVTELEALRQAVEPFSPEKVAPITGIDAADIRRIAIEMAESESAVCYSRLGASTQKFGGLCQWLTVTLNVLTGNMDSEGGAMFTTPAYDLVGLTNARHKPNNFGSRLSRVRKLPYNNNEFPVSTMADEILTEGEGQIRGLITIAGNPVISAPNGPRIAEALNALDFMVSIDVYINETSRHADIILPAASGLQVAQFDLAFHVNAVRNTVKYAEPLFAKKDQQKYDWEIIKLLNKVINDVDDSTTPEQVIERVISHGPYADKGISLESVKAQPHGIDLGPLIPNLKARLQTPDGMLHLAPQLFIDDIARLNDTFYSASSASTDGHFSLISRRVVRSHNSWTHNSQRLIKGSKSQCTLLINSDDANSLQLSSGQLAEVSSTTGSVVIEVEVSDEMMPGVVSIPQGWGHDMDDTQLSIAATQPGVNINELTDETTIDELTGNAVFSGIPVSIKAA